MIDRSLSPQSYENLDEVAAPAPIPIPNRFRQQSIFEEERRGSRGTPGADVEITALPELPYPGTEGKQEEGPGPIESYLATRRTASQRRRARLATELYTVSYLVLFSILGTLARLGMQWLTFYPGAPVVLGILWANFAGTLFMGFLSEDQQLFGQEWGRLISNGSQSRNNGEKGARRPAAHNLAHGRVKKTIPLYIGLTAGFCGSFTSFSSFMRDGFLALSNDLSSPVDHPYSGVRPSIESTVPRNGGYSFMAVAAVILLTICMCYAALRVGAHVAIYTDPITPTIPFYAMRRIIDPIMVFVAWGVWLGAVMMAIWPPDRPGGPESSGSWARETWRGQAIFACVFAPLGCLLRFYASLKLNGLIASFPLGTFAANVFGTAVLGMAFDLQHVAVGGSGVGGGRVGCQVLQGIMDGFCGCLTTVSTWILELNALKRGHSYVYGGASVMAGLSVLVVVMGSVRWSVGWSAVACTV